MKIFERSNISFILIVLTFSIYAGAFIYRTSFIIDGERYFSLFDDAMISMRYAKNFANGYGLIWNPGGERVEGYTNPLWVLYMSLFHLLPIPQQKISLFIQISGALLLMINLILVMKIAHLISNGSNAVSLGSVLLTAFYLPINNWSLQGMEVSLLTLIMSISLWQALQCIKKNKFCLWVYILLGISTFVRPDMIVPFLGIGLFLAIADPKNRSKNVTFGSLILLFCVLTQTIFRMWYYGDILPNTYYLKMTGYPLLLRISRGLYVFLKFAWKMNLILFLLPFGIFFFRRDKLIYLLFWVFLVQIIYSIYVGGDAWEWWGGSNRYLCIVMPSFFILFSYSLSHLSQLISQLVNRETSLSEKARKYILKYAFPLLLIFSLINFNSIYGPKALAEFLLIQPPLHTQDNKTMVEIALLLRRITSPQAKIAVVWAGAIPYFSDRYAIDLLGKNDKQIARERMRMSSGLRKFIAFYPGHLKYNYGYSIGQLKPDVVVQLWSSPEEAKPYLDSNYRKVKLQGKFTLYLRNESANVLWNEIKGLE